MRLHFTAIPVVGGEQAEADLNHFLGTHRVLSVERHLVADGAESLWAVCVSYAQGQRGTNPASSRLRRRVDYKEVLSPEDFLVFAALRTLRKEVAGREGVPPYSVFTNEQLSLMVQKRIRSSSELGEIPGVGPARLQRYGEVFLRHLNELGGQDDAAS